jgi:hypothetical protein
LGVLSVSNFIFLEDENIFQKSACVVEIPMQLCVQPREPIFELHLFFLKKTIFFSVGILSQIAGW